jgi:uncharacterized cofD-like protein
MMAPGDTRRALIALSQLKDAEFLESFAYRYTSGPLQGHVVGNLILAGLTKTYGTFEKAISEAKKLLQVKGDVLPASLTPATLCAELIDGQIIEGETKIDRAGEVVRPAIKKVWLKEQVKINPKAKQAIMKADLIIIGPGDLYTSIIPNFLVNGIPSALKNSKAKKVFVVNNITKAGETDGFKVSDFILETEKYAGQIINFALINLAQQGTKCVFPDIQSIPKRIGLSVASFHNAEKPGYWNAENLEKLIKQLPL